MKNSLNPFDWQRNREMCAGFYSEPVNCSLCNAEWQLPERRTKFLIWINAGRHSDLLRCYGYGVNIHRGHTDWKQMTINQR